MQNAIVTIFLIGCSLALPTPENEETDGEVSSKILGSSVVTSVSVIMDIGNGSQTYFSDAVGKPMTKPSAAAQLASPINLLNPDRYEFYTFDDSGDLVKRFMTLDEIQGIIASGDGEASNYNSQSGLEPEKRVDDVVTNVQNVLREEMEAHKNAGDNKLPFDTPDVTATWSMILPAIFGNSGEDILAEKKENVPTPETITLDSTTPEERNTSVDVIIATTEKSLSTNYKTESVLEGDAPVIAVEINNNVINDILDTKTESSLVSDMPSTNSDELQKQTLIVSQATARPTIIISSPSPFTNKFVLASSATPPITVTNKPVAQTSLPSTTVSLEKSSTAFVSTTTNLSPTSTKLDDTTTASSKFVTFFLVEDGKTRTETSTNDYFSRYTLQSKPTNTETTTKDYYTSPATFTTSDVLENITATESDSKSTFFNIAKEENETNQTTTFLTEAYQNSTETATTEATTVSNPDPSTTEIVSTTVETITVEDTIQPETTAEILIKTPLNYSAVINNHQFSTTHHNENEPEYIRITYPTTTEKAKETTTERVLTTKQPTDATEKAKETTTERVLTTKQPTDSTETAKETTTERVLTTKQPIDTTTTLRNTPQTTPTTERISQSTIAPEQLTTEYNLGSSIGQLILQAVANPEEAITPEDEANINKLILSAQFNTMSEVQEQSATVASASTGTTEEVTTLNNDLDKEKMNEAMGALVSQIIEQQPSQTTITSMENDGKNRYEEMELENLNSSLASTTDYKATTDRPTRLNNVTEINYEIKISNDPELSTKINSEGLETTENYNVSEASSGDTTLDFSTVTTENNIPTTTGTIPVTKTEELLQTEASSLFTDNYNNTPTDPDNFLIVSSSSEYPDYTSTETDKANDQNTEITNTAYTEYRTTSKENLSNTEPVTTDITETSTTPSFNEIDNNTDQVQEGTTQEIFSTTEFNVSVETTENQQENFTSFEETTSPTTILHTQQVDKENPIWTPSSTLSSTVINSQTPAFIHLETITIPPKPELKIVQNESGAATTTQKPNLAWTLVSTVLPHKTTVNTETKTQATNHHPTSVDLVPKPLQGFGLDDSTSNLDTDVFQFTELCNELAFSFWSAVTNGISFARSVVVSPFATTSMLAMVFLGARGATSGEMNEILKLDDMVTFNPHTIFKDVTDSIEVSKKSGVAVSVFIKELYSDKNKGNLLNFYKERVKQFYDGHVEEANFKEINDVIRRRTNLLVKRQTWGKIPEYLKENGLFVRPPLAAVSANIFQTDCSGASTEGRDGELHFVVLPSIRQRKLVPIPAVVWRAGFLAGYEPGLDATAVAIGTKDQTISTIFVIPGQQGISAPGDGLMRLESRLVESAFRQASWSRLLRSLIPRPGLEVQIPRFSHKSVINATMALQRMGLKDLFNSSTADLKGLNGLAHEFYLSDIVQINTFATCGEGRIDETHHSEVYPATTNRSTRRIRKIHNYHVDSKPIENNSDILEEPRDYQRAFHDPLYNPSHLALPLQLRPRQARLPDAPRLRFDRPFLYFVRHNPTGLILHMGRFNPRLLP